LYFLMHYPTFEDKKMNHLEILKTSIHKAQKIAVFSGAGISTSCGIPDFRGSQGIYSTVQQNYSLPHPEALFEINFFKKNPEPFFDFSKTLFTQNVHPSFTHKFLAELEQQGKEISIVTQNIDMLHSRSGSSDVVACHGSYRSGSCLSCNTKFSISKFETNLQKGTIPYCECGGIIKPDIVFFGEQLPQAFFKKYENPPEADLLLIIGSSLKVAPAARYPLRVLQNKPETISVLINNDPTPYDEYFTFIIHNDIDETFKTLSTNNHK